MPTTSSCNVTIIDMTDSLCDHDDNMIYQTLLYQHIGSIVRKRREALGMTQAQLAAAVGLLRTSIANLEAGHQRVPLHTLYPICAARAADRRIR